jgi:glycosyltransferase involved in cell wall biosynthesis
MQERVSPERYRTILLAESAFWDMEMSTLAGLERTARLGGRLFKHWLRRDSAELRRLTFQALRLRLLHSRKYRIARWRRATAEKLKHSLDGWARPSRPMVSVCMAAYNGERHIEAQLRSILPQLESGDEIVIVDDASRDGTLVRIQQIQHSLEQNWGPSLIVLQHQINQGVVRTFEDAVRKATGDILFLCDDDDLWAPDKVRKVLQAFAARPATQLVASGLRLIDQQNQPASDSEFLRYRRFTTNLAANLLHNQFQGSAMAFRASLIREVLPFPSNRLFLHDAWIGVRNIVTDGGTAYIDEPLLLYRRHSGNYTRILSRWKQLKRRLQLIVALMGRALSRV